MPQPIVSLSYEVAQVYLVVDQDSPYCLSMSVIIRDSATKKMTEAITILVKPDGTAIDHKKNNLGNVFELMSDPLKKLTDAKDLAIDIAGKLSMAGKIGLKK